MAVVTQAGRPDSVRNHYVVKDFGCVFLLPLGYIEFSVGVGAFKYRRIESYLFIFSL